MGGTSRVTSITLVLASAVALIACDGPAAAREADAAAVSADGVADAPLPYVDITVDQLRDMMASKDFVLVNVHTPWAGEIEGTDLNIPYDEIGHRAIEIPGGQDAKIVLYCRSGHMSAAAAKAMVSLGYRNVYNLLGGLQAWEAAGN